MTVGNGAMTGAGSVVTKDVEPERLVIGAPAKPIKSLDAENESKNHGIVNENSPNRVTPKNLYENEHFPGAKGEVHCRCQKEQE